MTGTDTLARVIDRALTRRFAGVIFVLAGAAMSSAQLAAQQFEAASIKPNDTDAPGGANFQAGGRFVARNQTLRRLISVAYGDPVALDQSRISGGPAWIDAERFDIEAKASEEFPEGPSPGGAPPSGLAMLRALLADRFKLLAHWETRSIPVYALVRRSVRLDPRLVSSSGTPGTDCLPPGSVAPPGSALPRCGSYILLNTGGNEFAIHARGITMTNFARNLQNVAARVVVDRTNLPGSFSFDLDFEYRPVTASGTDNGIGPAIFTAVQEQLGLRLEATTSPAQVLVIDGASPPSAD